jgi:outer membrane protein
MTVFFHRARYLLAVILISTDPCLAQAVDTPVTKTLDGYLGAGALSMPKYAGGATNNTRFVPLVMGEYEETAYLHLDRAGVRLWHTDDKKIAIGIAAQPRFGFYAKDGDRLAGMSARHDAVEGGAAFEWELPQFSLSVAYFTDWSDTSGGQSLQFSIDHQLIDEGPWDLSAYLDLDYANANIVQYYFGVRANEATATRPAYQPGAAVNSSLGFTGAYKLNKDYALLFGGEVTALGATAAASPIVQRRTGLMSYFGVGLVF